MLSNRIPHVSGWREESDVHAGVGLIFAGRVNILNGFKEQAPCIEHALWGRSDARSVIVSLKTDGWVVLSNDTYHYERNLLDYPPIIWRN